ncbi:MAG: hypothetical protein ACREIV_06820, partial [Planctomycetaceae bacterium]
QAATLLQLAFYGAAAIGGGLAWNRLGRFKLFSIPFFFCLVNAAAMAATFNLITGRRIERWQPQRARAG